MGKTYKTMQGKEIDMERLMRQHELMPAVGNAKVNARGDELGSGGKIVRKKEEIIAEYYENNPNAVPESVKPVKTKSSPAATATAAAPAKVAPTVKTATGDFTSDKKVEK
jgi:hypothetical protein